VPAPGNPQVFTFDARALEEFKNDIRAEIRNELREGLNTIKEELVGEIKALKNKVKILEENVEDLSGQLIRLEQYGRNKNIEVDNVEFIEGEVVEDIVIKLAKVLKIELSDRDIEAAHRLPSRKSTNSPKIIVQFASRKKRNEFVAARSQLAPVKSNHLVGGKSKERIYLNENLTRYYKELLWRSKVRQKEVGYKFVWFKFNKVFARKSETSNEIIRISSFADIEKIK
jgi:hypothetical protein